MESIEQIQKKLSELSGEALKNAIEFYGTDSRKGVSSLCMRWKKKMEKEEKEWKRLEEITYYERKEGVSLVAGMDEVGRGPLAGPVLACALILPQGEKIPFVTDSKKLSAGMREQLDLIIRERAVSIGIGIVSPGRIDEINILQATYEAMREAVKQLSPQPQVLLNDAVVVPGISIPQRGIIKGDAKSLTIGAASIVAKVARDRMMEEYDSLFPAYGFASNKGYGSAEHIAALRNYGPCPIHRRSFIHSFVE